MATPNIAVPQVPWHQGHSSNATTLTRTEAQSFTRQLLGSQAYRTSLEFRIKTNSLPPAVEVMLWHYAYGKPMEQVQLTVIPGTEDLASLPLDELFRRAQAITEQIAEVAALEQAIPATILNGPWTSTPPPIPPTP